MLEVPELVGVPLSVAVPALNPRPNKFPGPIEKVYDGPPFPPVAVKTWENDTPTWPDESAVGCTTIGGFAIVSEYGTVTVPPRLSFAVIENENVPLDVGVPLSTLPLRPNGGGGVPVSVYVYPPDPPDAVNACE